MSDSFDSKTFLKNLTVSPGVYQMFDKRNELLYVGKAKNLKNRVSNYFRSQSPYSKTQALVNQIHHVEVIVTGTESEALLLECNLIKKYKPRYNVLLRDDKSYPYIYLSDHPLYPRLDFHRGPKRANGRYFGPYFSAFAVRETLRVLQKLFRIRQCDDNFFRSRTRPCLQYQILRCSGPCVNLISPEDYQQDLKRAILFLEGKNQTILDELAKKMEVASEELAFEQAARYRDQIILLRRIQEKQYMVRDAGDIDVIAISSRHGCSCVNVIPIRHGQILGNKSYFPHIPENCTNSEILSSFIAQFYLTQSNDREPPAIILVNEHLPEQELLESTLGMQFNKRIHIQSSYRGDRAQWVAMALKNAEQALSNHLSNQNNLYRRFEALQGALNLENLPQRLECFDISHTMGEATVASCVVFDLKGPVKNAYRRFNIENITPGDDYAAMHQVLTRRYKRLKEGEGTLPDIIFIDGGRGQLHQAEKVLKELQVSGVMLIGIAKGELRKPGLETLWIAGHTEPLNLSSDSEALHLIQQIRDEAHRFAITGHRRQRGKARLESVLEQIPGVGPKRRRELLNRMGGLQEISRATVEDLAKIPGISLALAKRIYDTLREV